MYHASKLRLALALVLATLGATSAIGQNNNFEEPPPWQEKAQTPPATFELDPLIPVDNPTRSSLSYGVAPQTIVVGEDKVVRYVVIAKSPRGAMNVLFEGVRCDTREVKTYASWRQDSGWRELPQAQWQALRSANSRYAQTLANDAFCETRLVYGNAAQIVERLRAASKFYK